MPRQLVRFFTNTLHNRPSHPIIKGRIACKGDVDVEHIVHGVMPDSIASELGLQAGDVLLSIDGNEVVDIIDYQVFSDAADLTLLFRTRSGELLEAQVEKYEGEPLGLVFDGALMSSPRHCRNHCLFCFVDQLPCGLRKSLYFKDDDWRSSLMTGNFVTLTNVDEKEFRRILQRRPSPLYISVHTTDPVLRKTMLGGTPHADIMGRLRRLADAGIRMYGQIVACPGFNDGPQLTATLRDLATLYPAMQSVAIVPIGLTRYRDKLQPMRPFTAPEAALLLARVQAFEEELALPYPQRFAYPADELYFLAGEMFPSEAEYGDYDLLENGVGMVRKLRTEFMAALAQRRKWSKRPRTLVTGTLFAPSLTRWIEKTPAAAQVIGIRNDFFGSTITVSGLVVGGDIIAQLRGKNLGDALLLPENMLRADSDVFLDDTTVSDVEAALGIPVLVTENDGEALLQALADDDL